jgi:hypothetical protein
VGNAGKRRRGADVVSNVKRRYRDIKGARKKRGEKHKPTLKIVFYKTMIVEIRKTIPYSLKGIRKICKLYRYIL